MTGPDPILGRLAAIEREFPALAEAARTYAAILPLLRDAEAGGGEELRLCAEEARARLGEGRPLLDGVDLPIDPLAVGGLMERLADAIAGAGQVGAEGAALLRDALGDGRLDPARILPAAAAGRRPPVDEAAMEAGIDPGLLWTLAEASLRPGFRRWARQLAALAEGVEWSRGECPVCGAPPLLGELRGAGRSLRLRCGRCGSDWGFPRLVCPRCGSGERRTRRILYEEHRRESRALEACDGCRGYLKVIAAHDPTPAELLSAEDLATLHLDFIARERGYGVPAR